MASDATTRGAPCPAAGLPPRRSPATSGLDGTLSRIGANQVMRLGLRIDRADNRLLVVDWAALDWPARAPVL